MAGRVAVWKVVAAKEEVRGTVGMAAAVVVAVVLEVATVAVGPRT